MLLDMDLNFAPLSHYLDLHPDRGLLQALEAVEAARRSRALGLWRQASQRLRLLCAGSGPTVLPKDVSPERLARLIEVLATYHPHVVVDVPHTLDPLTATVFSLSTHVVLVLQQSLLHVRNAVRLLQILKNELGVAPERIRSWSTVPEGRAGRAGRYQAQPERRESTDHPRAITAAHSRAPTAA